MIVLALSVSVKKHGIFEKVEGFQQRIVEHAVAWWLKHFREI